MVAGITFAPILLSLSGAEGAVLEMGVVYLRTVFLGSIFVNFMQSANMVIRGEGRMGLAMVIMAGGAILNIVLDPILIIIFPERGPQAVAIATVISQFFQATVTLIYFLKKSPIVRFHGVRPAKDLIPEILSVGVSAMFMQVMMLIQMTVVYNTAVWRRNANCIDGCLSACYAACFRSHLGDESRSAACCRHELRGKKLYASKTAY